jgi:hypothetical protein
VFNVSDRSVGLTKGEARLPVSTQLTILDELQGGDQRSVGRSNQVVETIVPTRHFSVSLLYPSCPIETVQGYSAVIRLGG